MASSQCQKFFWVQTDKRGKSKTKKDHVGAMRSHCARHHHRVRRLEEMERFSGSDTPSSVFADNPSSQSSDDGEVYHRSTMTTPEEYVKRPILTVRTRTPPAEAVTGYQSCLTAIPLYNHNQFIRFRLDPTLDLPINLDNRSYEMLKYCITVWIPALYPENCSFLQKQKYYDSLVSDALVLSANLACGFASAAFSMHGGSSGLPSDVSVIMKRYWLQFKGITLQMIVNSFQESCNCNDNICFAISYLAGCEFLANNPEEGRLHLDACLMVARNNGGLHTISDAQLEIFCLDDGLFAALLGTTPICPLDEMRKVMQQKIPKSPGFVSIPMSLFANLLGFSPCNANGNITKALCSLFETTELINNCSNSQVTQAMRDTLVLRALFVAFELCACLEIDESGLTLNRDMGGCVRLAGLLVLYTTHMKGTPKQHLFDRLTSDLRQEIELIDQSFCWSWSSEGMLWTFFLGAYGCFQTTGLQYYLTHIRYGIQILRLETWEQTRKLLKHFPYINKEFDEPFESIWNLVQLVDTEQAWSI